MKFSIYNNIIIKDDVLYIYNSWLTKTLKFKQEKYIEEFEKIKNSTKLTKRNKLVKVLYEQGYIVDDEIDEYKQAKNWVEEYYRNDETLRILLYTTNQCNFRCIYCPQEHEAKQFSEQNWNALYQLAYDYVKNKNCQKISITFFGGEPLLESKSIIKFLEKLFLLKYINPKLRLYHGMTTNAYLLTPKMYDKLVSLGVKHYQITIDGMAETHNKNRPRLDGKETWEKIIKNLKYINKQNDNTDFHIRANINYENMNSVREFFEWFEKNFENEKFNYSYQAISQFTQNVNEELVIGAFSDDFRTFANELVKKYEKSCLNNYNPLLFKLSNACPVASHNYFVITVDGEVTKCELATGERLRPVGHLDKTGKIIYNENIKSFTSYEIKDCETCSIYPICGARVCPEKWAINGNHNSDCMIIGSKGKKMLV